VLSARINLILNNGGQSSLLSQDSCLICNVKDPGRSQVVQQVVRRGCLTVKSCNARQRITKAGVENPSEGIRGSRADFFDLHPDTRIQFHPKCILSGRDDRPVDGDPCVFACQKQPSAFIEKKSGDTQHLLVIICRQEVMRSLLFPSWWFRHFRLNKSHPFEIFTQSPNCSTGDAGVPDIISNDLHVHLSQEKTDPICVEWMRAMLEKYKKYRQALRALRHLRHEWNNRLQPDSCFGICHCLRTGSLSESFSMEV